MVEMEEMIQNEANDMAVGPDSLPNEVLNLDNAVVFGRLSSFIDSCLLF